MVFHAVGKGKENKEIAKQMALCVNTVPGAQRTRATCSEPKACRGITRRC
ncbi:MAG: response regulator transcription factor [Cyanobacteria bacterium K_Offshore_0m_m2_072]|nr:response regulator transcription factor [Cyanobacteria bacterium K_Offshore_0m_m2_072]